MSYVQFFLKKTSVLLLLSRSVMSDSLLHHRLQHTWLPCLSLSPRVCSNLGPLSQWRHPTISSSAITFSPVLNLSWHQGLFQWVSSSHLGGQSIGTAPQVLPMNIQGWFPLGLTGLISLLCKGVSRVFSSTTVQRYQFFSTQPFLLSSSHPYMTIGKNIALTIQTFVGKVMSHFHQWALQFLLIFCHKSSSICISEVIDISPSNLDSSVCFIQPSVSHDVLCIDVKKAGWQYTALTYSFPNLEPVIVPCLVFTVNSWPSYKFLRKQVK